MFITKFGGSWAKTTGDNPISKETAKLLESLKIDRPGVVFQAAPRPAVRQAQAAGAAS